MKRKYLILASLLLWGCFKKEVKTPESIDFDKLPYKTLSEYGFFEGKINELKPVKGLLPFEPTASLFTDYALKKRFVWIPEGKMASIPDNADSSLNFPEKTVLIKNFYYPTDFRKPKENLKIVETRLLVNIEGKWEAFAYLWNDEQSDATLKNIGAVVPVSFLDAKGEKQAFNYVMPQKTQCRSCHYRDEKMQPIGPKAKQLNHEIAFANGKANQLEKWKSLGKLKTNKDLSEIKTLVDPFNENLPLAERARSYLDVNCSNCHNPHGPASTSGLYLNVEETEALHLGILKNPVAAGIGGGGFKYDILPGKSKESILTYRMNSTHPGIMMPEIGRVTIHKEGVKLISDWIDRMK